MKRIILSALLSLLCASAWADITVDAVSDNLGVFGTTHSHTGGSPEGVVVIIIGGNAATTAVTYGGASMTEMSGSPATAPATGELAGSFQSAWILTTGALSGTQTVATTGPTSVSIAVVSYDTTSEPIEEVNTAQISSASTTDPTATITLSSRTSHVWQGLASGRNDLADFAPLSGWTTGAEYDVGATTIGYYTYDTIGTSDVTFGVTHAGGAEDDALIFAVAVSEEVAAGGTASIPIIQHHRQQQEQD